MTSWLARAVSVLFVSSAAFAAPAKIAILPFEGPNADAARESLAGSLCGELTCVPPATVGKGASPDFSKVRREGLELVVTGRVSGPANKRTLALTLSGPDGSRRGTEKVGLSRNGSLSGDELTSAKQSILDQLPHEEPAQATQAVESVPPSPAPAAETADTMGETEGRGYAASGVPLFWAEGTADFSHRDFSYDQLAASNLRPYSTQPGMLTPGLRAAYFPLARSQMGAISGLGLEAGYQFAVALQSIDEKDVRYPTRYDRLDLGARWDLRPIAGSMLKVAPRLGYRSSSFKVGAGPDGKRLDGLPDLSYSALRLGFDVETPLQTIQVFGSVAYLQTLGLGEIGSELYFPKSSGNGFEGGVGAGVPMAQNLQLRTSLNFTRYGLSFTPDPGAAFAARGASDWYLGGAVALRYVYE
jgi:hypothetical protein